MKAFAQTGLTLEVANPRFDLMEATVRLTDKVPDLRVVVGHLQALPLPTDPEVMRTYSKNLKELRARKAYAKISGLPRSPARAAADRSGGLQTDARFHLGDFWRGLPCLCSRLVANAWHTIAH